MSTCKKNIRKGDIVTIRAEVYTIDSELNKIFITVLSDPIRHVQGWISSGDVVAIESKKIEVGDVVVISQTKLNKYIVRVIEANWACLCLVGPTANTGASPFSFIELSQIERA